jgi:WD40 repeat protein
LHDIASGKSWLIPGNEEGTIRDLRFSQDRKWISGIRYNARSLEIDPGAGGPGQAVVLRVSDGQELLRTKGGWMNTWSSGCAAISPNQEVFWSLLSMDTPTNVQNGSVTLQATDIRTGEVLFEKNDFDGSARASALAISPDGHWIAVGCGYKDGTVYIIDARRRQFVTRVTGQSKWIGGLTFTKDSSLLLSGSADQSVFMWEVGTWKRKRVLRGAGSEIWPVAVTPDEKSVAVGDKNGTVFLLDLKNSTPRPAVLSFPASDADAYELRPRLESATI